MWTDFQLDQLVIDSAMEKREMEHKHATIQQRVSFFFVLDWPSKNGEKLSAGLEEQWSKKEKGLRTY